MIPVILHSGKGRTVENVKHQFSKGLVGGISMLSTRDFFRAVKLFCMLLEWWVHDFMHVKIYRTSQCKEDALMRTRDVM